MDSSSWCIWRKLWTSLNETFYFYKRINNMTKCVYSNCLLVSLEYIRRYPHVRPILRYESKMKYWFSRRIVKAYWEKRALLSLLIGHFYILRLKDNYEIHFSSKGGFSRGLWLKKFGKLNYVDNNNKVYQNTTGVELI